MQVPYELKRKLISDDPLILSLTSQMGLTTEEAAEQLEEAWNVDPDGYTLRDGVAEKLSDENLEGEDEIQTPPFGPPVRTQLSSCLT